MLLSVQADSVAYRRRYAFKWLRCTLRALYRADSRVRRALVRVMLVRMFLAIPFFIKGLLRGAAYPATIQIAPSIDCAGHCRDCLYRTFRFRESRIPLPRLELILRESRRLNVSTVFMIGADIFRSDDALAYLELFGRMRNQLILLFADGLVLNTAHIAAIRAAGNIVLMLNCDGLERTQDYRKGRGSFASLDGLFRTLSDAGLIFGVSTMVHRENLAEVTAAAYIDFLQKRGVLFVAYVPYSATASGNGHQGAYRELSRAQQQSLYERSLELNQEHRSIIVMDMMGIEENLTSCPAASNLFCVYHDGTMTPCFAVPAGMSASNIHSGAMVELFFSDPLFRRIREESRRRSPMKCLHYENGWLNEFIREHQREMTIVGPALLQREARGRKKAR